MKKNILFLMLVHCSNYIVPLITLPYLVRILGAEKFGTLAIIQAVCQYLILITDFGFNFCSTRDISLNRNDKKKVTSIFYATIFAKILIFLFCVMIIFLASFMFPLIRGNLSLIYISLLGVVGSIIFPVWLFQGLEKISTISIVSSFSKICVLLSIFVFVKHVDDLDVAVFINSLSLFVPGILSLFYVYNNRMISLSFPKMDLVFSQIKRSFPLFVSSMSTSFYTTMNTILMGWYCPAAMVGHYAAADKLRVAAQGLYNPIRQAVFPRATAMSNSKNWTSLVIKQFGFPFVCFGLLMTISFIIVGPFFMKYYLGEGFETAGKYLLIMSPIPLLVAIATVFGHWIMIAGGYSEVISKCYLIASILHIIYVIPLVKIMGGVGMVISVILTESIITIFLVGYVYWNLDKINNN